VIVYGSPDSLLATQIALRRPYGNVARKKPNLLQLTSRRVTEPSARSPQVVRRKLGDSRFPGELLYDMRDGLLRELFSPDSAGSVDSPEQFSTADTGSREPIIKHLSDPAGQWDCADMTGFVDPIRDRPVLFSLSGLRSPQSDAS
jgi:hypothetical protein